LALFCACFFLFTIHALDAELAFEVFYSQWL
jgi:hypothetical protein